MGRDVSQYLQYASDDNILKLTTLQQTYINDISEASTELNSVDLTGWEDTVATKLSNHCASLNDTYYKNISNEVGQTGNLNTLISLISSLKSKCLEYQEWDRKSYNLNLSKSDRKLYDDDKEKEMSKNGKDILSAYRRNNQQKNDNLTKISGTIDEILRSISSLEFSRTGIATDGITVDYPPEEQTTTTAGVVSSEVLADYIDAFGIHVVVTETIEITEDGYTKRTITEENFGSDEECVVNETSVTINPDDPSTGEITCPDGTVISIERDSEGNLIQKEIQINKKGGTNEYISSVEQYSAVIDITAPDGTVISSKEINADSSLDLIQVWMDYQVNLVQNGYQMNSDLGMTNLLMGGEATIYRAGEEALTFTLTPKE